MPVHINLKSVPSVPHVSVVRDQIIEEINRLVDTDYWASEYLPKGSWPHHAHIKFSEWSTVEVHSFLMSLICQFNCRDVEKGAGKYNYVSFSDNLPAILTLVSSEAAQGLLDFLRSIPDLKKVAVRIVPAIEIENSN